MNNDIYTEHLFQSLHDSMENAIKQYGKSNIEPVTYINDTKEWYENLFEKINENTPDFFVRSITVLENREGRIIGIEYSYFDQDESIQKTTLNIISDR